MNGEHMWAAQGRDTIPEQDLVLVGNRKGMLDRYITRFALSILFQNKIVLFLFQI